MTCILKIENDSLGVLIQTHSSSSSTNTLKISVKEHSKNKTFHFNEYYDSTILDTTNLVLLYRALKNKDKFVKDFSGISFVRYKLIGYFDFNNNFIFEYKSLVLNQDNNIVKTEINSVQATPLQTQILEIICSLYTVGLDDLI